MNLKHCVLFFEKYPSTLSWRKFFVYHQPFWDYITTTANKLFPINILYPEKRNEDWNIGQYDKIRGMGTLEDFFAIYFLLIIHHYNNQLDGVNCSRDQELWKHLWDRENWANRVSEAKLVSSLQRFKTELLRDKSNIDISTNSQRQSEC